MESLQQQILTDEREQHQATITFVLVKIAHLKADTNFVTYEAEVYCISPE